MHIEYQDILTGYQRSLINRGTKRIDNEASAFFARLPNNFESVRFGRIVIHELPFNVEHSCKVRGPDI